GNRVLSDGNSPDVSNRNHESLDRNPPDKSNENHDTSYRNPSKVSNRNQVYLNENEHSMQLRYFERSTKYEHAVSNGNHELLKENRETAPKVLKNLNISESTEPNVKHEYLKENTYSHLEGSQKYLKRNESEETFRNHDNVYGNAHGIPGNVQMYEDKVANSYKECSNKSGHTVSDSFNEYLKKIRNDAQREDDENFRRNDYSTPGENKITLQINSHSMLNSNEEHLQGNKDTTFSKSHEYLRKNIHNIADENQMYLNKKEHATTLNGGNENLNKNEYSTNLDDFKTYQKTNEQLFNGKTSITQRYSKSTTALRTTVRDLMTLEHYPFQQGNYEYLKREEMKGKSEYSSFGTENNNLKLSSSSKTEAYVDDASMLETNSRNLKKDHTEKIKHSSGKTIKNRNEYTTILQKEGRAFKTHNAGEFSKSYVTRAYVNHFSVLDSKRNLKNIDKLPIDNIHPKKTSKSVPFVISKNKKNSGSESSTILLESRERIKTTEQTPPIKSSRFTEYQEITAVNKNNNIISISHITGKNEGKKKEFIYKIRDGTDDLRQTNSVTPDKNDTDLKKEQLNQKDNSMVADDDEITEYYSHKDSMTEKYEDIITFRRISKGFKKQDALPCDNKEHMKKFHNKTVANDMKNQKKIEYPIIIDINDSMARSQNTHVMSSNTQGYGNSKMISGIIKENLRQTKPTLLLGVNSNQINGNKTPHDIGQNNEFRIEHQHYYSVVNSVTPESRKSKNDTPYTHTKPKKIDQKFTPQFTNSIFRLRYPDNEGYFPYADRKDSLPSGSSVNYQQTTISIFPILGIQNTKNEERDSQHFRKTDTSFTSRKPLKAPSIHRFMKTSPGNIRIPTSFQPTNSLINPFVYRKKFIPDDLDFDKHSENYEISTSAKLPTKIPIGTTVSVLTIGNKEYTGSELHYNKQSVTPNPSKMSFDYKKIATSPEVYKIYEKGFHSLNPDRYRNNVNDLLYSNNKESLPSGSSDNYLKTTTSIFPLILKSESAKNEERDSNHFRKIETPFIASKPLKTTIFYKLEKPKTEKIHTFPQPTTSLINPYFYRKKSFHEEDLDYDEYSEDYEISTSIPRSVKELESNKPIGTTMPFLTIDTKKSPGSKLYYNTVSIIPTPTKISLYAQRIATSNEAYKNKDKGFPSPNLGNNKSITIAEEAKTLFSKNPVSSNILRPMSTEYSVSRQQQNMAVKHNAQTSTSMIINRVKKIDSTDYRWQHYSSLKTIKTSIQNVSTSPMRRKTSHVNLLPSLQPHNVPPIETKTTIYIPSVSISVQELKGKNYFNNVLNTTPPTSSWQQKISLNKTRFHTESSLTPMTIYEGEKMYNFTYSHIPPKKTKTTVHNVPIPTSMISYRVKDMDLFPSRQQYDMKMHQTQAGIQSEIFSPIATTRKKRTTDYSFFNRQRNTPVEHKQKSSFQSKYFTPKFIQNQKQTYNPALSHMLSQETIPEDYKASISTSVSPHRIVNIDPFPYSQQNNDNMHQTKAVFQTDLFFPSRTTQRMKNSDFLSSSLQLESDLKHIRTGLLNGSSSTQKSTETNKNPYNFGSNSISPKETKTMFYTSYPTSPVIPRVEGMDNFPSSQQQYKKLHQAKIASRVALFSPSSITVRKKTTDYSAYIWQQESQKEQDRTGFLNGPSSTQKTEYDNNMYNFVSSRISPEEIKATIDNGPIPTSAIIHEIKNMYPFSVSQHYNASLYQTEATIRNVPLDPSAIMLRKKSTDYPASSWRRNLPEENTQKSSFQNEFSSTGSVQNEKTYSFVSDDMPTQKKQTTLNSELTPTSAVIHGVGNMDPFLVSQQQNVKLYQTKTTAQNTPLAPPAIMLRKKATDYPASSWQPNIPKHTHESSLHNKFSSRSIQKDNFVSSDMSTQKTQTSVNSEWTPTATIIHGVRNMDPFAVSQQHNGKLYHRGTTAQNTPYSPSTTTQRIIMSDILAFIQQQNLSLEQIKAIFLNGQSTFSKTTQRDKNTYDFISSSISPKKAATIYNTPIPTSTIIYNNTNVDPFSFSPESNKKLLQSKAVAQNGLFSTSRTTQKTRSLDFLASSRQQETEFEQKRTSIFNRPSSTQETVKPVKNTYSSVFNHMSPKKAKIAFYNGLNPTSAINFRVKNTDHFPSTEQSNLRHYETKASAQNAPFSLSAIMLKNETSDYPTYSLQAISPTTRQRMNRDFLSSMRQKERDEKQTGTVSFSGPSTTPMIFQNHTNTNNFVFSHTLPQTTITMVSYEPLLKSTIIDGVEYSFMCKSNNASKFDSHPLMFRSRSVHSSFFEHKSRPEGTKYISMPYTSTVLPHIQTPKLKLLTEKQQEIGQSDYYVCGYVRVGDSSQKYGHTPELLDMNTPSSVFSKSAEDYHTQFFEVSPNNERKIDMTANVLSFTSYGRDKALKTSFYKPNSIDNSFTDKHLGINIPYHHSLLNSTNLSTPTPKPIITEKPSPNHYLKSTSKSNLFRLHIFDENNQNLDLLQQNHTLPYLSSITPFTFNSLNDDIHIHRTSTYNPLQSYTDEKQLDNRKVTQLFQSLSGLHYRNNGKYFPYSNDKESLPSGFSDNYRKTTTSVFPFLLRIENSKNEEKDSKYFRKIETPFIASRPLKTPIFHRVAKPCPKTERVPTYFLPTASLINPFAYRKKSFLEEELVFDNYTENNATPTSVQISTKILVPNVPIGTTRSDLTIRNKESPTFKLLYKKLSLASKPTKLSLYDQQIATSTEIYKFEENELHSPIPGIYKSIATVEAPKALFTNNPILSNILRANNKKYISRQQQNMQEKRLKPNIHNAQTSTPIIISRAKKIDPLNFSWQHYSPFKNITTIIHNVPISTSTTTQRTNDIYSLTSVQPHNVPLKKTKVPINAPSISPTIDVFKSKNYFNNVQIANPPPFSLHHKILLDQTESRFHSEPSVTPKTIYGEEKIYNFERSHVVPKEPKRILHNVRIPTSPIFKRIPEAGTDPLVPSWQRPRLFKPLNTRIPKVTISTSTFTSRTNEMNSFTLMQSHNIPLLKTKAPLHAPSFLTTVDEFKSRNYFNNVKNENLPVSSSHDKIKLDKSEARFHSEPTLTPMTIYGGEKIYNFARSHIVPKTTKAILHNLQIPTSEAIRPLSDLFSSNQQKRLNQIKPAVQNVPFSPSAFMLRNLTTDFSDSSLQNNIPVKQSRKSFFQNYFATPRTVEKENMHNLSLNRMPLQNTKEVVYKGPIPTSSLSYGITNVDQFPSGQQNFERLHQSKNFILNDLLSSTTSQKTRNSDYLVSSRQQERQLEQIRIRIINGPSSTQNSVETDKNTSNFASKSPQKTKTTVFSGPIANSAVIQRVKSIDQSPSRQWYDRKLKKSNPMVQNGRFSSTNTKTTNTDFLASAQIQQGKVQAVRTGFFNGLPTPKTTHRFKNTFNFVSNHASPHQRKTTAVSGLIPTSGIAYRSVKIDPFAYNQQPNKRFHRTKTVEQNDPFLNSATTQRMRNSDYLVSKRQQEKHLEQIRTRINNGPSSTQKSVKTDKHTTNFVSKDISPQKTKTTVYSEPIPNPGVIYRVKSMDPSPYSQWYDRKLNKTNLSVQMGRFSPTNTKTMNTDFLTSAQHTTNFVSKDIPPQKTKTTVYNEPIPNPAVIYRVKSMDPSPYSQWYDRKLNKTNPSVQKGRFSPTNTKTMNTDFLTFTQQQLGKVGEITTDFFNGLPTSETTHKFKNTFNFVSNRATLQQRKTTAFSGLIPTSVIPYRIMKNDTFASNQQQNNRFHQTKTVVQNDSFFNSETTKRIRNSDFLASRPHQKRVPVGIRTYFFNAPSTPKTILGYKNTFSFVSNRITPQKTKTTLYNELIPTPAISYRIKGINPFPASQKGNTRLHHSKAYVQNRQIPFSTTVQETKNKDFVSSNLLHNILLQQKKAVYDYLPYSTSTASYRATKILVSNKPYNRPPKRLNLDVYDKPTSSQSIISETKKRNPLAFSQQPHVPSNIIKIPFPYQSNTVSPNLITYPHTIINEDGSFSYLPFQNNVTSVEQYTEKPTERKYFVGYKAPEHKSRLESARNGAVNISDYVLSKRNVVLPLVGKNMNTNVPNCSTSSPLIKLTGNTFELKPILFRSRNFGDNPLSKEPNNLTTKRPATLRNSNRMRRPNKLKLPRRKSVGMFIRKATINVPMFALEALNKDGRQKDFSEMIKEFENRRQRPGRNKRYKRKI
ncbi:hypothetical protein TNIN_412471, partial [Trichonephila inaurata madagascariensis]